MASFVFKEKGELHVNLMSLKIIKNGSEYCFDTSSNIIKNISIRPVFIQGMYPEYGFEFLKTRYIYTKLNDNIYIFEK